LATERQTDGQTEWTEPMRSKDALALSSGA